MCSAASASLHKAVVIAIAAVLVAIAGPVNACKIILFRSDNWDKSDGGRPSTIFDGHIMDLSKVKACRHVEKSGGTAVREYMHAYHPYWECIGQFCPAKDYEAYKKRESSFTWMSVVERFNAIAESRQSNPLSEQKNEEEVRLFAEIHNRGIKPSDFRKMIEALRNAEATGCSVLSLVILREPASQGISDFVYFHSDYVKHAGNPNVTFEEFVEQWPENLMRRLSATDFFGVNVRGEGYINDGGRQLKLYQEAKAYLNLFDLVATTEHFSSTWKCICHFGDLSTLEPNLQHMSPKMKSLFENAQGKCEDLASAGKVLAHDSKKEEDHIREHDDLVQLYNPVSQRIWEEAYLTEENFLYYFNKTVAPI